jgi:hypothetical protein
VPLSRQPNVFVKMLKLKQVVARKVVQRFHSSARRVNFASAQEWRWVWCKGYITLTCPTLQGSDDIVLNTRLLALPSEM